MVTMTRYLLLFIARVTFGTVNVAVYEPFVVRSVQVEPPFVLTCHWKIVGGGTEPVVPTVKVAVCPTHLTVLAGCADITGVEAIFNTAFADVTAGGQVPETTTV